MKNSPSLIVCTDNYPEWTVQLTYQGGNSVLLTTNGSNVYTLGGPWWVRIGDQWYFQYSNTIVVALRDMIKALGLPVGQPAATYCYGLKSPLLDMLY